MPPGLLNFNGPLYQDVAGRIMHQQKLAEESLRGAELDGYPVAHVAASEAAAVVPLSALSPLLPPGTSPSLEPAAVLECIINRAGTPEHAQTACGQQRQSVTKGTV